MKQLSVTQLIRDKIEDVKVYLNRTPTSITLSKEAYEIFREELEVEHYLNADRKVEGVSFYLGIKVEVDNKLKGVEVFVL